MSTTHDTDPAPPSKAGRFGAIQFITALDDPGPGFVNALDLGPGNVCWLNINRTDPREPRAGVLYIEPASFVETDRVVFRLGLDNESDVYIQNEGEDFLLLQAGLPAWAEVGLFDGVFRVVRHGGGTIISDEYQAAEAARVPLVGHETSGVV